MLTIALVLSINAITLQCNNASTDMEINECITLGIIQADCQDIGIDCDESYKGKGK